jgi:hypothetical protein
MITNQILKTLLDNASLSENDGLTFKDIQQCLTEIITVKVLQSMRVDGLINNAMKKNLNVWWLTAKGADMALVTIETMQPIYVPEPQCPSSAGGEYHVERISTRRMGSAKPITTTQWVAA